MPRYKLVSQTDYSPSGADEDVDLAALVNALIPDDQASPSAILTIRNDGPGDVLFLLTDAASDAAHTYGPGTPHTLADVALPFADQVLRVPDGTTCYLDVEVSV